MELNFNDTSQIGKCLLVKNATLATSFIHIEVYFVDILYLQVTDKAVGIDVAGIEVVTG